jgi:hypothetical protein
LSNDKYIEEYKTLREEIFEIDKRISNYVIYSVLATATLLGFGIQYPSPFLFLLPLAIIIPFSHRIRSWQNDILFKGTYISLNIENKNENLNWETFLRKFRKKTASKSMLYSQSPNTLLFNGLAVICLLLSVYVAVQDFVNNFFFSSWSFRLIELITLQKMFDFFILHVLWLIIIGYFIWWNMGMRKCFSSESQEKLEKMINEVNETNE